MTVAVVYGNINSKVIIKRKAVKYRRTRSIKDISLARLISYSAVGLGLIVILSVAVFMLQGGGAPEVSDSIEQSSEVGTSTDLEVIAKPEDTVSISESESLSQEISSEESVENSSSIESESSTLTEVVSSTGVVNSVAPSDEYRAVWISYLEFESMNMSSEQGFVQDLSTMLDNTVSLGLNTVIFHVRPFGDALYNSSIFPTSHLITGTQGASLPYDPLEVAVRLCHERGLKIEAWVNPYRVQLSKSKPGSLASSNPAVGFMNSADKSDYVVAANDGLYYNPAYAEVQDLIVSGVVEIINNYDVDGIQFDDYFYPTTEASFDAAAYSKLGGGMDLSAWRRENVNELVQKVYNAVKATDASVYFGISPQGNNSNNYNQQYSDVNLWLSTPGYVDYIMPQLYWGFDYLTASGREDYQFAKLSAQWASYPQAASVSLYIGLGAFRIGVGDGGANDQSEWSSGDNLARQIETLRSVSGIDGFALYRYDNLYKSSEPTVSQEIESIKAIAD